MIFLVYYGWMQQSRIHFVTEVTVHTTQFTVNAR